jgi:hypothetical protein
MGTLSEIECMIKKTFSRYDPGLYKIKGILDHGSLKLNRNIATVSLDGNEALYISTVFLKKMRQRMENFTILIEQTLKKDSNNLEEGV